MQEYAIETTKGESRTSHRDRIELRNEWLNKVE